jgi:hypothetical protein
LGFTAKTEYLGATRFVTGTDRISSLNRWRFTTGDGMLSGGDAESSASGFMSDWFGGDSSAKSGASNGSRTIGAGETLTLSLVIS